MFGGPVLTFTRCQYWKKQTKVEVKKIWIQRKQHSRDFFDTALYGVEQKPFKPVLMEF